MKIMRAIWNQAQGRPYLQFVTDQGDAFCDSPKQVFLEHGFIPLWGFDVETGRVESEVGKLPPAPADGRWSALDIPFATYDPVAVHLAFQSLAGELEPGEVEVPTLEEAEKWKWEFVRGQVVKKMR